MQRASARRQGGWRIDDWLGSQESRSGQLGFEVAKLANRLMMRLIRSQNP